MKRRILMLERNRMTDNERETKIDLAMQTKTGRDCLLKVLNDYNEPAEQAGKERVCVPKKQCPFCLENDILFDRDGEMMCSVCADHFDEEDAIRKDYESHGEW